MEAARANLADFIRQERQMILARWEARSRRAPVASDQARATLLDRLPELLERIGQNADDLLRGRPVAIPASLPARHAAERFEQGYDLGEVVEEYIELRACVLERVEELGFSLDIVQFRYLNRAVDDALREAAARYLEVHGRMLRAVDRVSARETRHRSVDEVLMDIVRALKESAGASVDSVAILLVGEDERLRVRATLGLEEALRSGFSLAIGEGFAGRVAESAEPLLLKDAAANPLVQSPTIRRPGTRALYGVPLVDDGHVIGVLHIGSSEAPEFAEDDLMLFRAMAVRASAVIVRAQFVEALERTARFREQFIGVLGHDLRAPVSVIIGTAKQLLMQSALSSERLRSAHRLIERSAARIDILIRDILDFTRARLGGGFMLAPSRVSLREVAREVVGEFRTLASRREIVLEADEVVSGTWDRVRLTQALSNLVQNAIQHSPDGSKIRVTVRRSNGGAIVEVWNTGEPLAPELRSTLFQPFSRSSQSGGLGLGAYIAHEIVRAHDGTLDCQSDERGTTFTMRLPGVGPRPT